jgi:RNA polymerase sigma-70 factor (ECF subfamily)
MAIRNGGKGRDNELFRSLYDKYYRRIIRMYVYAFRLREEDAEELAQDVFVRFYEAMDDYRGEAEWALLETIARNVALNRIRSLGTAKRSGKTVPIDDPKEFTEPQAPAEPDYAERQHEALRRKRLHDAVALLPAGQRQCMQLWLEDFKYEEIARTLRITVDAVRSRLRDAKRELRARLGVTLPEDEE